MIKPMLYLQLMDYCVNDLPLSDRQNREQFVTITKQEYQQLNRQNYRPMSPEIHQTSPNPIQPLELDYEMPRLAFTFRQPKWSQIQQSIDILKRSAPNILNPNFLQQLYRKIYAKLPLANQNSPFFVYNCSKKAVQKGSMTMNFDKRKCKVSKLSIRQFSSEGPEQEASLQIVNQRQHLAKSRIQIDKAQQNEFCLKQGNKTKSNKLPRSQKNKQPVLKEQIAEHHAVKMRKVVIQIFCDQGYNPQAFQEELIREGYTTQISSFDCQEIIKSILHSAYSKLQAFLKIQCKLEISSLSLEVDDRTVINSLMNYKQTYSHQCCQTLQNILRGQCGLTYQPVTQSKAIKLYEEIEKDVMGGSFDTHYEEVKIEPEITVLQTRIKKQGAQSKDGTQTQRETTNKKGRYRSICNRPIKQIDSVRRLNSVWNSRYQTELIFEYKNGKSIGDITLSFQQKYPKDRECFCPVAMRSALYKICRQAVRKLQNIIQQFGDKGLPPLIAAGHHDVRGMVYNNNGIEVRLLLLDVYMLTSYDKDIIVETINCMNSYVQQMKAMEAKRDERVRKQEFLEVARQTKRARQKVQSRQKPRGRRERPRKHIKEYKIDRASKGYYVSY